MAHVAPAERAALRPVRLIRVLRIVLAGTMLLALLYWVGPAEVWARIAGCPPDAALLGLAAALLSQLLAALRFQKLAAAECLPLSRTDALGINLSTVFYGLFLPGGAAASWVVRLLRLPGAREQPGLAVRIIAGDRVFATVVGTVIGLGADLVLQVPATPVVPIVLLLAAAGAGVVGWGLLSPALPGNLARLPGLRWLRRAPSRPEAAPPRAGHRLPTVTLATLLSVAAHGFGIVAWWVLARAVGLELGLLEIAWVRSAALVVGLLPLTVGGLGLREGTTVALLSVFGVPAADALSLSLLAFTVTVLGVGVIGGLGEAVRILRKR
jgi:uncharacterized membrane protein YbhN (UPF0104 family)